VILRRSDHIHIYHPRFRVHDVMCGGCFGLVASAAEPIMKLCDAAGIEASMSALQDAIKTGRIMLYAQESLEFLN
jgi:hypothetical protein